MSRKLKTSERKEEATVMEQPQAAAAPAGKIIDINKDEAKAYISDADAIIVQREIPPKHIHFGFGPQNVFSGIPQEIDGLQFVFSGLHPIPQEFGGNINIKKKYGDGYATICNFYINDDIAEIIPDRIISKEIEQFIQCINKFSNYIKEQGEKKKIKIIFNRFFLNSSYWQFCQKEIEKFAQKHNTINVYCVKNVTPSSSSAAFSSNYIN